MYSPLQLNTSTSASYANAIWQKRERWLRDGGSDAAPAAPETGETQRWFFSVTDVSHPSGDRNVHVRLRTTRAQGETT